MINCTDEDGHLHMYGRWSNVIIAGGLGLSTFKKICGRKLCYANENVLK